MVILDSVKYNTICEEYKRLRKGVNVVEVQAVFDKLAVKYSAEGIPEKVIRSIADFLHQWETRLKVGRVDWSKTYKDYKNGKGTIVDLSRELDISPTIVAKRLILNETNQALAKSWILDTSLIPDGRLAIDVMTAQYCDYNFGHIPACITSNAGELFESEVGSILRRAQVCYTSENTLRRKEFDVTPDFKLNIPLAIAVSPDYKRAFILPPISLPLCQLCSIDKTDPKRIVVCWIECKASFASLQCHRDYLKYQLNSYANRFGRGLVIYKYGFVKNIIHKHPKLTIVQELIHHQCDDPIKWLNLKPSPVNDNGKHIRTSTAQK